MEANEAPEKIYVPTAGDELHYHMTCPNNEFQESIEYTRTDAFIKKVCRFLDDRIKHDSIDYPMATNHLIEDFKNYIKGG